MQTFLPYPDFRETAVCLDWRRLGRQRVEAYQILRTLSGLSKGWNRHPAVKMWAGYELALSAYMNEMIKEWMKRGYKNNMYLVALPESYARPEWLGDRAIHTAYRSNLIRKDPDHYREFWPDIPADLPYIWPV